MHVDIHTLLKQANIYIYHRPIYIYHIIVLEH